MESSRTGSPEGLSFCSTRVPVGVAGAANVSVTLNGTKSSVIQSPCAWAGAWAITFPFPSSSFTGNEASKYQVPRARPVTVSGLPIFACATGAETWIRSACGSTTGTGVGIGVGVGVGELAGEQPAPIRAAEAKSRAMGRMFI